MSTLAVVEKVLRAARVPLTAKQIAERAGRLLPSTAKRPDMVVARDLSLDLRRMGDRSKFARTARGQFTLRELVAKGAVYIPEPRNRAPWKWTPEQIRARLLRQRASAAADGGSPR